MKLETLKKTISIAGSTVLAILFAHWFFSANSGAAGYIAALVSVTLFCILCLRFVPAWVDSWSEGGEVCPKPESEKRTVAKILIFFLLWDVFVVLTAYILRIAFGYRENFSQFLNFWTCIDSRHYLDIARDWYISEGSIDRLVQLVFLPGYPLAVRAMNAVVGNYVVSGLLVSALCFSGVGGVFYKLLRLDLSHECAVRALKYLCLSPAVFFFAAPMSESLFLLLCLACIYLTRRGKLFPACILGAFAAFTRSLGIVLVIPVLFELITARVKIKDYICLLIIPLGFAAYCLINYQVSGDAFKFMEYQSSHWNQQLGLFWNTAAYQTENLIISAKENVQNALGLWLPNLLAAFMCLGIMTVSAKRIRPSYTAFFIAYFVIAIGATWLLSAPRYLAAAFVPYIALAQLTESRGTNALLSGTSAVLLVFYFCAFVLRWQVW